MHEYRFLTASIISFILAILCAAGLAYADSLPSVTPSLTYDDLCPVPTASGGLKYVPRNRLPVLVLPLNGSLAYYNAQTGAQAGTATYTRSTTATYWDSTGTRQTAAINAPRYAYYNNGSAWVFGGLLKENGATNYLPNSGTPANLTTGSLATGTYCLWVEGSGSCTVAGATATITGAGTATSGTPVVFVVTVAGTVSVTVSGSLTIFQLEKTPFPTSYIPTTAAPATRAADSLTIPWPDNFDAAGSAYIKFVPLWGTGAASGWGGAILGRGTAASLLYSRCGVASPFTAFLRSYDGINNPINTAAPLNTANTLYNLAVTWGSGRMKNYVVGAGSASTVYDGTWNTSGDGSTMSIGLGENAFFRDLRIWDGCTLTDAEIGAL